jgi:thioesterase domain-containing protein
VTESKKMTTAQHRDEWRNLALQERERANNAEEMRDAYFADLERATRELDAARSWESRWERWRGDVTFVVVLIVVAFAFLFVTTR